MKSESKRGGGFQTQMALILSACFLITIVLLSSILSIINAFSTEQQQEGWIHRHLDDISGGDDSSGGDAQEKEKENFESRNCEDLYDVDITERCEFARSCNDGEGLFASFVFCYTNILSTFHWCIILSPFLLLWLITLFRMLGTTAEDFFSPSLEMFSIQLGLPPRFAGVSLLALGNGAADVSATMNAIVLNPSTGYQMSLGALTGASMFVGTVVAGMVIVVAEGVPCRGALVRDVTTLAIGVIVVFAFLATGAVGPAAITTFITMYIVFVSIVLLADIYHRAMVMPRLRLAKQRQERQRQQQQQSLEDGNDNTEQQQLTSDQNGIDDDDGENAGTVEMSMERLISNKHDSSSSAAATLQEEEEEEVQPIHNRAFNAVLMAMSNYDGTDASDNNTNMPTKGAISNANEGWSMESDDDPLVLHGANGILTNDNAPLHQNGSSSSTEIEPISDSPYTAMIDDPNNNNNTTNTLTTGSWRTAWYDGREELRFHFQEQLWNDLWHNEENSFFDKFFMLLELPFTIMRKLTVPIPCNGYYCRALVALSLALSPIWIGIFFQIQHDINVFVICPFWYLLGCLVLLLLGAMIMRFAPAANSGDGDADGAMPLMASVPVALFGFIVAATWIDAIADQLVSLLGFLGVIFHIPTSIMGLTVLAWGNSIADLSANIAMARKGLANMAITACFAGPVFNILIGLGTGFSALASKTGHVKSHVTLTPPLYVGFIFVLLNCILVIVTGTIWNKGFIPKEFGYVALALYTMYIIVSIVLQFAT